MDTVLNTSPVDGWTWTSPSFPKIDDHRVPLLSSLLHYHVVALHVVALHVVVRNTTRMNVV